MMGLSFFFFSRAKSQSTLVKDPKKKYLFGLYPHGVIGISAWANFFNTVSPVLRGEFFPSLKKRTPSLSALTLSYFLKIWTIASLLLLAIFGFPLLESGSSFLVLLGLTRRAFFTPSDPGSQLPLSWEVPPRPWKFMRHIMGLYLIGARDLSSLRCVLVLTWSQYSRLGRMLFTTRLQRMSTGQRFAIGRRG